ncbi:hypothetical protein [Peribacillus frigoritolerans]|uniref:hypothetical protein n=1 Tax=Peribacillus frigoritolerans TaxID=450367 RepID=UPI002E1B91FF|nr:hypothetical protein [Peribacillus frigoritolerans]
MALGIGGVAGAAKVADKVASGTKFIPYSKEFAQKQVQKVQAFGREIGKVEVPLRIRVEELATAYGNNYKHVTFDKTTIKDIVQKFAVKSDGGKGVNGTGSKSDINVGKEDLERLRKKLGVPETQTIAIGKTDIKGLEGIVFEGGSPKVRKEAGLPSLDELYPGREIKAPYNRAIRGHAQFMDHAEEGIIAEFEDAVKKARLKPEDMKGTLYIHQSNPNGICNKCTKGLFDPVPNDERGIFKQMTDMYPNLKIKVTTEINPSLPYPRDTLSFEVINGVPENVVKIRK